MFRILGRFLTLTMILLTANLASAEPYFASKDGSMILDKATNLVWMRCALGQTWDGKTCSGEAKKYNFDQTQQAAKDLNAASGFGDANDWVVPTVRQFAGLRVCSSGFNRKTLDIQDGGTEIFESCNSREMSAAIDSIAFPNTPSSWFWTNSPYVGKSSNAWVVDFGDGGVGYSYPGNTGSVRLVRASQLSGDAVALGFSVSLKSMAQKAAEEEAEKAKRQAIAEAKQRAYENSPAGRADAKRARERADYERAHACDKFYQGKVVGFKPAGALYFGNVYKAMVLGSGGGRVSIKITDRSFDGETLELPCDSNQLQ